MIFTADYLEKIYAGWLGKVIGVRHGAPVEGWSHDDIMRIFPGKQGFLLDVDIFEPDDDINGPLFFLRALEDERSGEEISPLGMAKAWINYSPYEHGFFWWPGFGKPTSYHLIEEGGAATLEHAGEKPGDGLGPRIFSDTWGLISPDNPDMAVKLIKKALQANAAPGGAAEDAAVLQVVLLSLAFQAQDAEGLLASALAYIPENGDISLMARDILALYRADPKNPEAARLRIAESWLSPRYPGMFHAVSNTAYILLGLLYSEGDMKLGLDLCTRCGLDTDCNSGNLGAVLGVLGGLKSIDSEMRSQVNDVALCSSILGEQNAGDIPTQAKYIALQACRLAGQTPSDQLIKAQESAMYLDFSLPGSTHGLRVDTDFDSSFNPIKGGILAWCNAPWARTGMDLYHPTYYRPKDVHNSRYDPCFSPKVYPGQKLTAKIRKAPTCKAMIAASVFAYDDNDQKYYESTFIQLGSEDTELHYQIPKLSGALISKVGVRFLLTEEHQGGIEVILTHLSAFGQPDYIMDFSKERIEQWGFVHHECSQFTYTRGRWAYNKEKLTGLVASHGEVLTGARSFRDIEVSCTMTPFTEHGIRLMVRVQGAFRYYAAALVSDGLALLRQNHGETVLARVSFNWRIGQSLRLTLAAAGERLSLFHEGKLLLEAWDEEFDKGCVGLGLSGSCAGGSFEYLTVKGLEEEH